MKKEDLQKLGLTEEQINEVFKMNGLDVNGTKSELEEMGNADKADITIMKNRRTATYNEYKEFAKAMGLPEEMARVFTKGN